MTFKKAIFLLVMCLLPVLFCRSEKTNLQVSIDSTDVQDSIIPDSSLLRKAASLDSFFTTQYQQKLFNGTVLFAEKGIIIFKKAYGFADFKQKDTLSTGSVLV